MLIFGSSGRTRGAHTHRRSDAAEDEQPTACKKSARPRAWTDGKEARQAAVVGCHPSSRMEAIIISLNDLGMQRARAFGKRSYITYTEDSIAQLGFYHHPQQSAIMARRDHLASQPRALEPSAGRGGKCSFIKRPICGAQERIPGTCTACGTVSRVEPAAADGSIACPDCGMCAPTIVHGASSDYELRNSTMVQEGEARHRIDMASNRGEAAQLLCNLDSGTAIAQTSALSRHRKSGRERSLTVAAGRVDGARRLEQASQLNTKLSKRHKAIHTEIDRMIDTTGDLRGIQLQSTAHNLATKAWSVIGLHKCNDPKGCPVTLLQTTQVVALARAVVHRAVQMDAGGEGSAAAEQVLYMMVEKDRHTGRLQPMSKIGATIDQLLRDPSSAALLCSAVQDQPEDAAANSSASPIPLSAFAPTSISALQEQSLRAGTPFNANWRSRSASDLSSASSVSSPSGAAVVVREGL